MVLGTRAMLKEEAEPEGGDFRLSMEMGQMGGKWDMKRCFVCFGEIWFVSGVFRLVDLG